MFLRLESRKMTSSRNQFIFLSRCTTNGRTIYFFVPWKRNKWKQLLSHFNSQLQLTFPVDLKWFQNTVEFVLPDKRQLKQREIGISKVVMELNIFLVNLQFHFSRLDWYEMTNRIEWTFNGKCFPARNTERLSFVLHYISLATRATSA